MGQPAEAGATRAQTPPPDPKNASTGALLGKKDVDKAKPPLPTETIASVQADVETVKQGISR